MLFPQLAADRERYIEEKVRVVPPADRKNLFLSPYYGWVIERLVEAIRPDTVQGEAPRFPATSRTADRDHGRRRLLDEDVREVVPSHLNYVVADTRLGAIGRLLHRHARGVERS